MQPKPTLIKTARITEREETYRAALILVNQIEPDPRRFRLSRNYRNRAGKLLETLPEVVNAILADDLAIAPERLAA